MLNTWEFGTIRIINRNEITTFDSYIRSDILDEYDYYQLVTGEIVAIENYEEE